MGPEMNQVYTVLAVVGVALMIGLPYAAMLKSIDEWKGRNK
jgi:hypothetical protein